MTLESSVTFFLAVFVFGITPGPGIFVILAKSMTTGARSCFLLCMGMVLSDIVYLIMACLGLAAIASAWENVFLAIRYLGAAYLMYLGWKMWVTPPFIKEQSIEDKGNWFGLVQGFLISASNPKVILFYIAFLPTFMDLTILDGGDIALAACLAFVALMSGVMMVAFGAARAGLMMKSQRAMKSLNKTAGGIMVSAGAFLALKS